MDNKTFQTLAHRRFEECKKVLAAKNAEYSRGGDKLHNFKRASAIVGSGRHRYYPEDALEGMWLKHLVSILDMIDDVPNLPTIKLLDSKITDAINYLVLLEALFMEQMEAYNVPVFYPSDEGFPLDEPVEIETNPYDEDKIIDEVAEKMRRQKIFSDQGDIPF